MRAVLITLASLAIAADYKDVDPNVFPKDDARASDLPKMMQADARKRMQEASLRESKAFAAVNTKDEWEKYRDARIQKLRASLGQWPPAPTEMRVRVTRELDGDGYVIHNVVYESRPGLWVCANLYLPKAIPAKMPGIVIAHSHHGGKTGGELQDMGMMWARAGAAVLVPDQLGYGERREHDFHTDKDYDKPFRVSRQDYFFRYNSNLQLSAAGESLMGWMAWDLMRGIDLLFRHKNIDKDRIILMGAVAGGGDPAGVTAALDPRVACVVPFNFGGWQPESSVLDNPERDFAWFGDGYWESTRGLKNGARDGFSHFVIVGSVAPRKVIYAHEFGWDATTDPAWPRLQKIFGFYGAKDGLRVAHGKGSVRGPGGPDNTHCNHIGAVHRKMIYAALKEWFGMPVPEEYSKNRPASELKCWTEEAKKELKPKRLHEAVNDFIERQRVADLTSAPDNHPLTKAWPDLSVEERRPILRKALAKELGDIEPTERPKQIDGKAEDTAYGRLARFALETDPGIVVPFVLLTPKAAKEKCAVVVMVSQGGKAAFLARRADAIEAFLGADVAVCLVDVRGTGEVQSGDGSPGRSGARTSVSQTNLILGQTVLGLQLCDLRTVIRWLHSRKEIDAKKVAVWGDSFAEVNPIDARFAVPLDAPKLPHYAEPGGAALALLAGFYEPGTKAVLTNGGLMMNVMILESPYVYVPHEAIIPGWRNLGDRPVLSGLSPHPREQLGRVWGHNAGKTSTPSTGAANWVIEQLKK